MTILSIGKRLVPLEHIVLVEPFDPSTQTRMQSDKPFQTRVVLLDRENLLSEQALATFVDKHGFRRVSEDGVTTPTSTSALRRIKRRERSRRRSLIAIGCLSGGGHNALHFGCHQRGGTTSHPAGLKSASVSYSCASTRDFGDRKWKSQTVGTVWRLGHLLANEERLLFSRARSRR